MNWQTYVSGLVVAGSLVMTTAATAGDFQYKIRNFPSTAADCPAHANALSDRFADLTGADVYTAECTTVSSRAQEIVLRYTAAQVVPYTSTAMPLHFMVDSYATYQTRDACAAAMSQEIEVFKVQTGLEILTSFCVEDTSTSYYPWIARIDGVGRQEPLKQVYATTQMVFGRVLTLTLNEFVDRTRTAFASRGAVLRSALVRPSFGMGHAVMTYYHIDNISLDNQRYAEFKTLDQCKSELPHVDVALQNVGRPSLVTFCAEAYTGALPEIQSLIFRDNAARYYSSADRWPTFEACVAGRDGVLARLRERGRNVVGSICNFKEASWQLVIFEKV